MIETLKNAFRNKDIRRKIFITLLLLLVFRQEPQGNGNLCGVK